MNDDENENNDSGNYRIDKNKTTASKSFEYKTKIIGSTPDNNSRLDAEVAVPLKYLSNYWGFLHLFLINWEIELDLTGSRNSIISEISMTAAVTGDNLGEKTITGATFQINNAEICVPVTTLSINDNIK